VTAATPQSSRLERTDRLLLAGLLALALAPRLALIGLNSAEYTDGILQINAFQYGFPLWPPLYTLAVKFVALAVGDPVIAGRLVSILAGSLLVVPIYLAAHRLAGRRAAVYAVLFWLVNAVAGRWSLRVMSDMLFALLFFWSSVLFLRFIETGLPFDRREGPALEDERTTLDSAGTLFVANLLGALALLTRLQGILLMIPGLLAIIAFLRARRGGVRIHEFAALAGSIVAWIAALAWFARLLPAHGAQTAGRASDALFPTLLSYGYLAECFVLLLPYFITIPVFVLCLVGVGLFLAGDRRGFLFALIFLALGALLIGIQAVFQAFQERYLLPLIPFMTVLAGAAAARWEAVARRPAFVRAALVVVLLYSFGWMAGSLALQRDAFGDLKRAAVFCRTLPAGARIFSNESYDALRDRPDVAAVKMTFWANRPVRTLTDPTVLQSGDYVCLHSFYGGLSDYPTLRPSLRLPRQLALLRERFELEEVDWFQSGLVPLLPDITENPDLHASPAWWIYRYAPQRFRTVVLRIVAVRAPR